MRLIQCLSRMSVLHLRQVADTCGISVRSLSKQTLIAAITTRFRDAEFLAGLWQSLPQQEQVVLAFLVRQRIETMEWDALVERITTGLLPSGDRDARDVLETLCSTGLVIRMTDLRPPRVCVPVDVAETLRQVLSASHVVASLKPVDAVQALHPARPVLQRNLFHLLALAAKERIRLTRQGKLFRRTQEKVEDLFLPMRVPGLVNDALLHELYPHGTDLVLAIGFEQELVHEHDETLEISTNVKRFVAGDELVTAQKVLAAIDHRFVDRDLQMAHLRAVLAEASEEGPWYPLDGLIAEVVAADSSGSSAQSTAQEKLRWFVETLWASGMIDLGRGPQDEWVLRLSSLGRHLLAQCPAPAAQSPEPTILLPDFRLIVPVSVPLADLWQIERFADLVTCDVVLTYTITRESVYRALKWGDTTASILDRLARWTNKALSQNVVYTIESWGQAFGRISFADVLLLRCDTEELAAELRAIPELARYIRGAVTPRDLVVDRSQYEQIVALLEQLDYLPKPLDDNFSLGL